uniref:Uncharacterized protein n=1 Tax=Pinguiococcus pyrenoidosus TaxID=172671 RepID=A0A7R9YCT8_9STRA
MADNLRELNDRMASFEAWRREQEEMDISDVRRKQDAIIEGITALQHDLVEKIDRADVDEKIEAKYQEIIDHLQTALESTHEDEDEFRRMTATLKTTVENLQTLKADRREVVELRRQVVLQQAQGGAGAGMSLAGGISRDELLMLLDDKMDKQEWDVQMEQLRQRLDSVNAEMGEIGYALKQMEGGKSNAKFARLGRRATISDPEGRAFVASSDQTWSGLAAALRNAAQSPGQSTANGTPFYPAAAMASDLSKLRPITVPGIASENAALATNVPIVNANKYGLNPRNAYGGGFQLNAHLLPPRAPHSPFPQGPDSHSPTYDRGPPLRSGNQQELREINVALPPSLKRLVKGTDGKFYRGELREPATASDSEDAMDDEDASHDSVASRREDP